MFTSLFASSVCWTPAVPACISGHDDWIGTGISDADACKELCINHNQFKCLPIEFKDVECHLSQFGQLTLTLASDYQQPCSESGWIYAERMETVDDTCTDPWSPVRQGCIEGHNVVEYYNIGSVQD